MTTHDRTPHATDSADDLISRIVDGEASPEQWQELEAQAAHHPRLWRDLAQAQRDASALRGAMSWASDVADHVDMPPPASIAAAHDAAAPLSHPHPRMNRFGAWTGWLVAALITFVASVQIAQMNRQAGPIGPQSATQMTGTGASVLQSAADAWNAYLRRGAEEGSVLGEIPGKMVVESRPASVGQGYEVIFVRQVVERAIVPDLYQVSGIDERGQPTLVRYRQPLPRKSL